jgi:hypothetical protein
MTSEVNVDDGAEAVATRRHAADVVGLLAGRR